MEKKQPIILEELREDKIEKSLNIKDVLKNVEDSRDRYIVVPIVVE